MFYTYSKLLNVKLRDRDRGPQVFLGLVYTILYEIISNDDKDHKHENSNPFIILDIDVITMININIILIT